MTSETISNTGGSSESRTRFGTALTIDTELITEFRPTELTSLSDRKPEHKSDLLSPDQRDQNSLAIPDLSLSVGKVSDDIHMIEPVTPLTDLFTLDSIATSKGGRTKRRLRHQASMKRIAWMKVCCARYMQTNQTCTTQRRFRTTCKSCRLTAKVS